MNKDTNDACVDSSYQFADVLDDNILLMDYSRNFLAPAMRLSCYEEEVIALQILTIDIRNKIQFFFFLSKLEISIMIQKSYIEGLYMRSLELDVQQKRPGLKMLVSTDKNKKGSLHL